MEKDEGENILEGPSIRADRSFKIISLEIKNLSNVYVK